MPASRWATPAFVAVVLVSLVVLFLPHAPAGPPVPDFDKLVHAALFGALAATTRWRFGARRGGLAAVVVYACVSEVLQAVLPIARDGDPFDALADSAGALIGWVVVGRRLSGDRDERAEAARVIG